MVAITTLRELVGRYALLRGLGRVSQGHYQQLIDRMSRHLDREPLVTDLEDVRMAEYLRWRAETPGWRGRLPAAATVEKDRRMIRAMWEMSARKKWSTDFPELPKVKVPKRLPLGRAYTADDVARMIRQAQKRHGLTGGLPSRWWWSTLLWTAAVTGERLSALLALRWAQVDLEAMHVVFLGATRKGQTRDIRRAITPELAALLAEHRRQPADLVWPWDRRTRSYWSSLQLLCRLAGVQYRGFHGLRRCAASYAALAGGRAAATRLLDHADPRMQEVYVDEAIAPDESAGVTLPPLDLGETDGTVILD
jgi:integrase